MKARLSVLVCLGMVLACIPPVFASEEEEGDDLEQIPSCGSITSQNEMWQWRPGALVVAGFAQSRRNMDGCASKMRVEAWVEGVTMLTAINEGYGIAVSTSWIQRVPHYGVWTSVSKHWLINFGAWLWGGFDNGSAELTPLETSNVSACDNDQPCQAPSGGGPDSGSPLILDVNADGFDLTTAADGVLFDLDADGVLDRVSWTAADSDDAWLAMDRNGNGIIDDGGELFGNYTAAYPGQRQLLTANGFDALKFLEGPDFGRSNGDGTVDGLDAVFGKLLLWTDRNHNGISEPEELRPAASSGIVSLSTEYKEVGKRDPAGNLFKQRASSVWSVAGAPHRRHVYDVWLRIER
jgi:hypothetical protein